MANEAQANQVTAAVAMGNLILSETIGALAHLPMGMWLAGKRNCAGYGS
jgi:hypothetical protein